MLKVTHVGTEYSDYKFEVILTDGTCKQYLITPYHGRKWKAEAKKSPGKIADLLEKHGRVLCTA